MGDARLWVIQSYPNLKQARHERELFGSGNQLARRVTLRAFHCLLPLVSGPHESTVAIEFKEGQNATDF